jgi:hypothetical protein
MSILLVGEGLVSIDSKPLPYLYVAYVIHRLSNIFLWLYTENGKARMLLKNAFKPIVGLLVLRL